MRPRVRSGPGRVNRRAPGSSRAPKRSDREREASHGCVERYSPVHGPRVRGEHMARIRVGLLFGGRSVEHEVSISSATSILQALDPDRYDVTLIAIDPDGRWRLGAGSELLPEKAVAGSEVRLPAVPGGMLLPEASSDASPRRLDVVFPIVHGRGGEDGQVQGLLELAEIPYVGIGRAVLGGADGQGRGAAPAQGGGAAGGPGRGAARRRRLHRGAARRRPGGGRDPRPARLRQARQLGIVRRHLEGQGSRRAHPRRSARPPATTRRSSSRRPSTRGRSRWRCSGTRAPRRRFRARSCPATSSTTTRRSTSTRAPSCTYRRACPRT